jgi:hypothetical protein
MRHSAFPGSTHSGCGALVRAGCAESLELLRLRHFRRRLSAGFPAAMQSIRLGVHGGRDIKIMTAAGEGETL